ncbi:MAG: TonB-dependent receptor [Salinisphaeraceae bacterium]
MRILVSGAILALSLGAATAAEPETLEPIAVEALPLGDRGEAEALQPAAVVADDELLRQRDNSLGRTLDGEPGVSSSDFGVGVGRPVIRGLSGARVRVQENGLGSGDVSTLSVDHAVSIDPLSAHQIEVLKGPATLLYGSGAIGGVVNVVTHRIPRAAPSRLTGHMDLAIGDSTLDDSLARLDLSGGAGPLAWNIQGGVTESDDYQANDNRPIGNSFSETDQFSGGAAWTGDRGYLGAAISGFGSEYGIPGEDAVINIDQDRVDLGGEWLDPLPGFDRLEFAGAHTDYLHDEGGEVFFANEETELRLALTHGAAAGWTGALGIQAFDRQFEAFGEEEVFVPPVDTRNVGLFAVEERPVGAWTLQLGGRIEYQEHQAEGGNPDRDHTPVSLSVGGLRPLSNDVVLAVNLGQYQRGPAAEELYSNGPHEATQTFERGDLDLDEETANSLDLGLRQTAGRLRWSVNLFVTDYADFVFLDTVDAGLNADGTGTPAQDGQADRVTEEGLFDPAGELLLLDYNAADAMFYGAEFELGYDLLTGATGLTARVFGDMVRGELDDDTNLPRITPARLGLGLDVTHGPWQASLEALTADDQERTAPLETATDGYTDVTAFIGVELPGAGARTQLYLRGDNLLDEEIIRHTSFLRIPQPGRRFSAGLSARF